MYVFFIELNKFYFNLFKQKKNFNSFLASANHNHFTVL